MNEPITFVTSNEVKFLHASEMSKELGFTVERQHMDLQEIQSEGGEEIVRHKAEQAYAALQKPIIVTDDTWIIPGLKGFPGPYMKSMNAWFTPDDWLRLTNTLEDRRIILQQHGAYQDEHGQQYFVADIEAVLLHEIRGEHYHSHLTVLSYDGGTHSGAEALASGDSTISPDTRTVWHELSAWLQSKQA